MLAVLRTARRLAPAVARSASRRRMTAPAVSEKVEKICDDVCQLNVLELKEFLQGEIGQVFYCHLPFHVHLEVREFLRSSDCLLQSRKLQICE